MTQHTLATYIIIYNNPIFNILDILFNNPIFLATLVLIALIWDLQVTFSSKITLRKLIADFLSILVSLIH